VTVTAVELVTRPPLAVVEDLTDEEHERLTAAAHDAKAPATWRAYNHGWRHFLTWCTAEGRQAMPASPQTVALYLDHYAATLKVATLQQRLSAIRHAHAVLEQPSPTADPRLQTVWAGIRRRLGTAQREVAPATTDVIRAMVATLDLERTIGLRDRALLLLGFAGAFRRSELVALDVADIVECDEGLRVYLRRSKTDQEGRGTVKPIPYGSHPQTCPVRAWRAWVSAAGITEGPAFYSLTRGGRLVGRLSDKAVALIVKRSAAAAGLDPAAYSGHSLRAGFATAAAAAGVDTIRIMDQTGHKSVEMVRRYVRHGSLFHNTAAAEVGL
jgi:site-specific recombinase XerD